MYTIQCVQGSVWFLLFDLLGEVSTILDIITNIASRTLRKRDLQRKRPVKMRLLSPAG